MKITVFTSNQPRHHSLINKLAAISDETYAVMECNTVFPGQVNDFFKKSDVMQDYFENVMRAEKEIFNNISFLPKNVHSLPIKSGDLSKLNQIQLEEALNADIFIVFGASYIKGWLIDFLVEKKAINIHMGVSPYYRGSSCNFWALYDKNPNYVGSTIHYLSKGLDSGPILYHALPTLDNEDGFAFTMKSVKAAHDSLAERIKSKDIFNMTPHPQDKLKEIKYTKNADFNDDVAKEFLDRNLNNKQLKDLMESTKKPEFLNAYYA